MNRKSIVIKLNFRNGICGDVDHYTVEKIVNSTEFRPGQRLVKKDVDVLIDRRDWRVEIGA